MHAYQLFVGLFAAMSVAVGALAIWRVGASPHMTYKPLWIAGCLFGFIGFAVNWTSPGDLYLQFGVQLPMVMIRSVAGTGDLVLKALFPLVAIAALAQSRSPRP
jgi:hypothetical protein